MVKRLEKIKETDPWSIQASTEAKKDQGRGSDSESSDQSEQNDQKKSSFEEKTDWIRMVSKEGTARQELNFFAGDLHSFKIDDVSQWKGQVVLQGALFLKNGLIKKNATITLPRAIGQRFLQCGAGEAVSFGFLTPQTSIRVVITSLENKSDLLVQEHRSKDAFLREKKQKKRENKKLILFISVISLVILFFLLMILRA